MPLVWHLWCEQTRHEQGFEFKIQRLKQLGESKDMQRGEWHVPHACQVSHLLTGTVLLTSTLSAFELPYMQHISMGTALFTQPALSVSELEKKTDGRKMKWLLISKWFINRRHLLHIRQEEMKAESHIPSDWLVMELELSQNQALLKVAFFHQGPSTLPCIPALPHPNFLPWYWREWVGGFWIWKEKLEILLRWIQTGLSSVFEVMMGAVSYNRWPKLPQDTQLNVGRWWSWEFIY